MHEKAARGTQKYSDAILQIGKGNKWVIDAWYPSIQGLSNISSRWSFYNPTLSHCSRRYGNELKYLNIWININFNLSANLNIHFYINISIDIDS